MKSLSYKAYLSNSKTNKDLILKSNVDMIIERLAGSRDTRSNYAPTVFLTDYTLGKYIYVDESCFSILGFTAEYFMESGVDAYLSKWHPDDFNIFNQKIFPTNIALLKKLPPDKYKDIVFSYNYRILNAENAYINMLQRFTFIPGVDKGKPLGILGVITDITHFKTDQTMVHTIEEIISSNHISSTTVLLKKNYHSNKKLHVLSKRETEILSLIGKGLSSKQIANHLGISIHTVNNHRKNMIFKTKCLNSSDLLHNSIRNGII